VIGDLAGLLRNQKLYECRERRDQLRVRRAIVIACDGVDRDIASAQS
jgi:hypothetical protein